MRRRWRSRRHRGDGLAAIRSDAGRRRAAGPRPRRVRGRRRRGRGRGGAARSATTSRPTSRPPIGCSPASRSTTRPSIGRRRLRDLPLPAAVRARVRPVRAACRKRVGVWAWTALLVAAVVAAVALMPVRREVRWLIVLLAALDWPRPLLDQARPGRADPAAAVRGRLALAGPTRRARGVDRRRRRSSSSSRALLVGWALLTGRVRAAAYVVAGLAVVAARIAPRRSGPRRSLTTSRCSPA